MAASLLLLGICWLLPLGLVGWSYYRYRTRSARMPAQCQIVYETTSIDVHSGTWLMLAEHRGAPISLAPTETYEAEVPKAQSVVRLHTPQGTSTYRRCEAILN